MKQVKFGIIGSGMMGQEHIRNIHQIENASVAAVADPDEGMRNSSRELAGEGCKAYEDYREMLRDGDVNALLIASPNYTHIDILKSVLETDLPILVEKPLCTTMEDCRFIMEAAKSRAAPIWVAMEYRYMPPVAELINFVHDKKIGNLKTLTIREHRFPFLEKVGDWNRFNDQTGGTLIEKCCHFFDLMRLITKSNPVRVYASGG
ncbi:MAG: Gfo/Idh/MocA family oxidoreductase, partial [Alphaproteobacteria bacterium]|nr:Gfo/Idh/MocA family oxidoreductase [Alphaproteobacteria bacterium]